MQPAGLAREAQSPTTPAAMGPPGTTQAAVTSSVGVSEHITKRYNNIVSSQEDKRSYRGLELTNKMKVLLVSDPSTDKSAAALDVNIGYLSDPEHLPGLAHFCEHMLFLGTKKYPKENEYNKFLSEHGGNCNASTSSDHTTYYFDVLPQHLPAALDIFAQFFISPLFTEDATDRELNAVNSEHDKNRSSDMWRLDQLNKSTAHPDHPYSKFGTGNRETLETIPKANGVNVRGELLVFHQRWYSADIMTLIVFGKESLDELEGLVAPLFAQVEARAVEAPRWPEHPYPPELRRKRAYVEPVKDIRSLSINLPVPDNRHQYKSGPAHYLSHLLGHEGPGSLLSALRKRGWCNSLMGGSRNNARGFGMFTVQVDLTEEGVKHVDEIVKLFFQYIALVRKEGPKLWIWEEQRDLVAMMFRFLDAQEPRSLVSGHVHDLQDYPMEDVLSAHYLLSEWRPDLITELLDLLTPDNVRIGIVAKCFSDKCTETEKWYGTKYLQEDIEEKTLEEWRTAELCPELHLPPPNEFIPSRLDLAPREEPSQNHHMPSIIRDSPCMRLWYKQDNEFLLPKACLTFNLVSPLAYADPLSCNLMTVWSLLLRDSLVEYAYAAELAGLRSHIGNIKYAITVTIEGYDDKLSVLLDKVMDKITSFKADPDRFHIMKENHIRALKNFEAEQPYQHAVYHQALMLTDQAWTRHQLISSADDVTVELLEEFAQKFVRRVHIESLMYGNLTRERALAMAEMIEKKLPKDGIPLLAQQLLLHREVEMEEGSHYLREVENAVHRSSCASIYYSCGVQAARHNVLLELLLHVISEPCFDILRTKEQLGYIVFAGMRRSNGVQGLRVIVQSDRTPAHVEERVEAFLASMEKYLIEMPDAELEKHRAALSAQRLEKPKQMSTRVGHMCSEINSQQYHFDRARVEVEELSTVTRDELFAFYKRFVWHESPERTKLSVHVVSTVVKDEAEEGKPAEDLPPPPARRVEPTLVTDLLEFKAGRGLYPNAAPYMKIPRKGANCKL